MCTCEYTHVCICMYVLYVCMKHVCTYVRTCVVCMYVCTYVGTYVCMHVCMYIYIHAQIRHPLSYPYFLVLLRGRLKLFVAHLAHFLLLSSLLRLPSCMSLLMFTYQAACSCVLYLSCFGGVRGLQRLRLDPIGRIGSLGIYVACWCAHA